MRAHCSVRQIWPAAVEAALSSGQVDLAAGLVDRMAVRPPGRIPPLLKAELRLAQGLLAAARGEHDRVEPTLVPALEGLGALGYPFWSARARAHLAAWLLARGRRRSGGRF